MDEKKNSRDDASSFSDIASKYIPNSTDESTVKPSKRLDSDDVSFVDEPVKKYDPSTFKKTTPVAPIKRSNKSTQKFTDVYSESTDVELKKAAKPKRNKVKKNKTVKKEKNAEKKSFLSKIDARRFTKDTYVFFGVVIVLSLVVSIYAVFCVNDLFGIMKSKDNVSVILTDEEINSRSKTINVLKENKLINCPLFCKAFAAVRTSYDKDGNRKSSSVGPPYTAATFELNGKMGLEGMLMTMQGGVAEKETVTVTFPEGYTVPQILKKLVDSEVYSPSEIGAFEKALQDETFTYALSADLKVKEEVPYKLEGYLFPDTYTFYKNEKPKSAINKFLGGLEKNITKEDREKAEQMGYTMEQIIIIASIIEKEAGTKAQMPVISRILYNRLAAQTDFPMLGCDSTANYIRDSIGPSLTVNSTHNAAYYSSYYDTYTVLGLPAGPICNPGMNAINAALNPDPKSSKLFFFCHDLKGNMYTAQTLEQHRINTANHVGK